VTSKHASLRGFSLVEIMIVSALLAILISVAIPAYRDFTLRAHRAEAIASLMQLAGCQERIRAVTGAYDTRQCLPGASDRYGYQFEPGAQKTFVFRVTAIPHASQSADRCGSLILDQDGFRNVGNLNADTNRCWGGR
jgi:type IV pilus assembly protein PilE